MKYTVPLVVFTLYLCQYTFGYRKYYVEDECLPSSKRHKILLRLPATGPDSVGEIRSNRFGTYSRTERNCLFKLTPPHGYGVILTVLKIDFRKQDNCADYIQILTIDEEGEKLCGYKEFGFSNQTYFSDEEIGFLYHTSGGGIGFNNGIRVIFTVTKTDDDCSPTDEFRCRNSHCIWAGVTCDGINNCGDASDENFSEQPFCPEITPVAITAVILGIISFIAIFVTICVCCCRTRPEFPEKPNPFSDIPTVAKGGYISVPGYNYHTNESTFHHMQPIHSSLMSATQYPRTSPTQYPPTSPTQYPPGYSGSALVTQKLEIRYERPPPYDP